MILIINILYMPLRFILPHKTLNKLGMKSLKDERYKIVKEHCRGRLLDIGCGDNMLVKEYGNNSIGVDVYDFGGEALIVDDCSKLPFSDKSFDTVSLVASIQHIPNRQEVIKEAHRVLKDDGIIIITVLSPFIGFIRHKLTRWWDEDQIDRGMKKGELDGLTSSQLNGIMKDFTLIKLKEFVYRLNSLYIYKKI